MQTANADMYAEHPLLEVRMRAQASLCFKLENQLLSAEVRRSWLRCALRLRLQSTEELRMQQSVL